MKSKSLYHVISISVFTVIWFAFVHFSTRYYFSHGDDLGASYWGTGNYAYPIALGVFFYLDRKIQKRFSHPRLWVTPALIILMLVLYPVWLLLTGLAVAIFEEIKHAINLH